MYTIFLNGEYPEFKENHYKYIKDRVIYCADGGANFAYEHGILPHYLVGDLDSVRPEILSYFKEKGVKILSYSSDKDYTDFVLCLMHICNIEDVHLQTRFENEEINFYQDKDIVVFGATGYRVDMTLANLKMLLNNTNMRYISHDDNLVYACFSKDRILGKKGKKFSLIPMSDIEKLSLKGFRYELDNKDIQFDINLASNVIEQDEATVEAKSGSMIIMIEN